MIVTDLKMKVFIYLVTSENNLILNISLTNLKYKNEDKQKDTDAYDLQKIKKECPCAPVVQYFYVLTFLGAKASEGMHQICIEKSHDRHLSIHPH